ncbi:MAG: Mu transposase C-terminal domain-containing protein [Nitrospirae bacterium]|nr:Mu transposase C-terminal domain-containing protein [Nitrospirota bacterium]
MRTLSVVSPIKMSGDSPESEPAPVNTGASQSPQESLPLFTDDGMSAKSRQVALARMDILKAWEEYRRTHEGNKTDLDQEFEKAYNTGIVLRNIRAVLGDTTVKTLYRWKKSLNCTGDWKLLAPQYNGSQSQRLFGAEEKIFLGCLLSANKVSIGEATRLTKFILKSRGIPTAKSDMTFRRYAEDFMAKKYDVWVLMREGQKALKDKVEPYIKRDPSLLNVGDALVADGHRLNFQIINPYTGKPCRATLVAYIDWKSFDLAGYEIMVEENTQCIASALRNSIIALGKKPVVSYQDNGKAFRSRFFTGSVNLEEAGFNGLFGRLGIIPLFAMPYNARAKVIERWFKEFSNTFERLLPSYIGSSISDKPAYMMRNEKFHKALHNEYIPTIEETVQLIQMWLEFHRSQECPHVKGKPIGEVFSEGKGPGVEINELDDLMMDVTIKNIRRNGITFLNADYYDDNLYGLREQVMIRYSLFDLSYIKVYALNGEFVCVAKRVMSVHPLARVMGTPKDVEELRRGITMQRKAEKKTIQGAKELIGLKKAAELDWQKVVEISPRIADRLEAENIQTPAIEERIPEECVTTPLSPPKIGGELTDTGEQQRTQADITRLEPQSRPLFNDNIERYQWHLEYGVFTEEDQAWVNWFMTTDDFNMLFTFFEKQKRKEALVTQ